MKIIGDTCNRLLVESSHRVILGYLTGTIRIIAGIAQAILNTVALIFSSLCCIRFCMNADSICALDRLTDDLWTAINHTVRGIFEIMPGSSAYFNTIGDSFDENQVLQFSEERPDWPWLYTHL